MEIVNMKITLDLLGKTQTVKVYTKRLDDIARHLTITIVKGEESYTIPTNAQLRFQGTKPDNTHFCNDCILNDNNTIDVELTSQILAATGVAKCEIEIEDASGLITASTFYLNIVDKALSPDVVKSTDEYKSIYKMLLEVRQMTADLMVDSALVSQKADEAAASAKLADDVVNCVPLANIETSFTSSTINTDQHVLSSSAGKTLYDTKVEKVSGKGLSTNDFTNNYRLILDNFDNTISNITVPIEDSLSSTSSTSALSARQGHILSEEISNLSSVQSGDISASKIKIGSYYLDTLLSDKVFGVTMSADIVNLYGEDSNPVPFAEVEEGFDLTTNYVTLDSNKAKVLVRGIYFVSMSCYISDAASGTWNGILLRNGTTFAENMNSTNENVCSLSASGFVYCNVGDLISVRLHSHTNGAYRLSGAYTHLEVYPIKLMGTGSTGSGI